MCLNLFEHVISKEFYFKKKQKTEKFRVFLSTIQIEKNLKKRLDNREEIWRTREPVLYQFIKF